MAGRAIWKGVITFAGFTAPVKLHSAIRDEGVSFNLLHDKDHTRLMQQMVCPVDNEPVERDHRVKGYEVEDNRYVVLEPREFDELEPPASREIAVTQFFDVNELDVRFLERPYYLSADGASACYTALVAVLKRQRRAGLCKWVMRKKTYLGALLLLGDALALVTMRYADEIAAVDSLQLPEAKLEKKELTTAKHLIGMLSSDFRPDKYRHDYQQRVKELVEKKARGEKIVVSKAKPRPATESDKLLQALEASLKQAKARRTHDRAA